MSNKIRNVESAAKALKNRELGTPEKTVERVPEFDQLDDEDRNILYLRFKRLRAIPNFLRGHLNELEGLLANESHKLPLESIFEELEKIEEQAARGLEILSEINGGPAATPTTTTPPAARCRAEGKRGK